MLSWNSQSAQNTGRGKRRSALKAFEAILNHKVLLITVSDLWSAPAERGTAAPRGDGDFAFGRAVFPSLMSFSFPTLV